MRTTIKLVKEVCRNQKPKANKDNKTFFGSLKDKKLIEHLISQKGNINDDDNLISCFLTIKELNYLIKCVESFNNVEYNFYLQKLDELIDNQIEDSIYEKIK